MYASYLNHLAQAGRYFFAFVFLFVIFPRLIFRIKSNDLLDYSVANYIRMVFIIIVIGYSLILLKLFELLMLFALFIMIFFYSYMKIKSLSGVGEILERIQIWIYDLADGIINLRGDINTWWKQKKERWRQRVLDWFGSVVAWGNTLLFLAIFLYAAFLRFYDTFQHAAPSMSDAYVIIAWLKYLDRKILFHDGIYPHGFHLYLDFIHKFSSIDPLYVVNYSGPLHGVFITLSIYFIVTRLTGRQIPGLLAAFIYGVLGEQLASEWIRQAAANSQEFAFVFNMPAIYYYYRYLREGNREDLRTASAATFVMGLVHTLSFAYVGMGMGIMIFIALISNPKEYWQQVWKMCVVGVISVVIALLPAVIGLLMGKGFYGASAEFLVRESTQNLIPKLMLFDYIVLASLGLLLLYIIFDRKNWIIITGEKLIFFLGSATFLLYLYGGVLTHNVVISTRVHELWSLMVPVVIGMGYYTLCRIIPFFLRKRLPEIVLAVILIVAGTQFFKPSPIIPYKMEYDSGVEQYLHISTMFRPTDWMIVSQEEGYALTYGKGYHLMLGDFLEWYNPWEEQLVSRKNGSEELLVTQDIFIYREKKMFIPKIGKADLDKIWSRYERREKEYEELKQWVEDYRSLHDNLSIFYEDENIIIYRINQPPDREKAFGKIWG